MRLSPVLSKIQPATIDTMLNHNGLNVGDLLNFVTCEQTFKLTPSVVPKFYRTLRETLAFLPTFPEPHSEQLH